MFTSLGLALVRLSLGEPIVISGVPGKKKIIPDLRLTDASSKEVSTLLF